MHYSAVNATACISGSLKSNRALPALLKTASTAGAVTRHRHSISSAGFPTTLSVSTWHPLKEGARCGRPLSQRPTSSQRSAPERMTMSSMQCCRRAARCGRPSARRPTNSRRRRSRRRATLLVCAGPRAGALPARMSCFSRCIRPSVPNILFIQLDSAIAQKEILACHR